MTPARKPKGRTLAEFEPLQPAEKKLRSACWQGEVAHIADSCPEAAHENNTVRAGFLRFLALGGDGQAPVHERGVWLQGAWITGTLDLISASVPSDLSMVHCQFSETPLFTGTNIAGSLVFTGSRLPGFAGQGMTISGNLICNFATFDGKEGDALAADGAVIKGGVFLKRARATGTVHLLGVQIGGNLECHDATFDGKKGFALAADGMTVTDSFIFKNKLSFGRIVLAGVHIGRLTDDINSWGSQITLDGLTYGSIAGGAPTDAATRLAWLDKQSPEHAGLNGQGADFKPQPWRQLAKVLREMGHAEDARQVSIAFEKRLREAGRIGLAPASWGALRTGIYQETCRAGHCLFGWLTGYGYRPLRLLAWMVGVWLACALFFWYTALEGVFGPSSPLVFQHPAYADCQPPGGNWYICGKLPEEYSGFSPLAYSLDVILPFVDLQQANSWAPLIPTPEAAWYREILAIDWKHFTRLLMWFETLFGWVSSLLMVAVVSGLAKRREE